MKQFLAIAALAALALATLPAQATDVGVSVQINQPGVYGRIDIGRFPQPQVVVAQPVIIQRPAVVRHQEPVYLYVPQGHRKNWRKHCRDYDACGVPVYFVQHQWYDRNVHRRDGRDDRRDYRDDRRDDRRGDRHERRDDRRDDHRGRGHGKHD